MPPISRSEYLYGRPLLERFISSSCFSHSGSNVIASERPTATLRASVSADDRLGLLYLAGLVFRSLCFGTISGLISARYIPIDRPAPAVVTARGAGLVPRGT